MARPQGFGWHFFKGTLWAIALILAGLMYWSMVLTEQKVRELNSRFNQLQKSNTVMQAEAAQTLSLTPERPVLHNPVPLKTKQPNPDLKNLLEPDPFYSKTLPSLLPKDFRPWGTIHHAMPSRPEQLGPFSQYADVSGWQNQCVVSAARFLFGFYEQLSPDMAYKIEEEVDPETQDATYTVYLRDGVFWAPLEQRFFGSRVLLAPHFQEAHQVTAEDFKLYFDAMKNPYVERDGAIVLRQYYADLDLFEVIDPLTFRVRWKAHELLDREGKPTRMTLYTAKLWTGALHPLPAFVFKYFADGTKIIRNDSDPESYRTNSTWAQNFNRHWSNQVIPSCGPWLFDGMNENRLVLRRNPSFYAPLDVLIERYDMEFMNNTETIWNAFLANKLETYELSPAKWIELQDFLKSPNYKKQEAEGNSIHQLSYLARVFTFIGWNQARPLFTSKKVRQALTMAVDRERIIRDNLHGLGVEVTGPFFYGSTSYNHDIVPFPFNPPLARKMLEEEGWEDSDGDGILDKEINGVRTPFRFHLTYFYNAPVTRSICEYVSTALKEIGIDCILKGVDRADISAIFDNKDFEALYFAWAQGTPPESATQVWGSSGAKEAGSSNFIGFANKEVDRIADLLQFERDAETRQQLYHELGKILYEEAPYLFLYTPKVILLYRDRVKNLFIPSERQDLIPGATVSQPETNVIWLKPNV